MYLTVLVDRGCVQPWSSSQIPWPLANVSWFSSAVACKSANFLFNIPCNWWAILLVEAGSWHWSEWLAYIFGAIETPSCCGMALSFVPFIEFFMSTLETPRLHRISQFHGEGVESIRVDASWGSCKQLLWRYLSTPEEDVALAFHDPMHVLPRWVLGPVK